MTCKFFLRRSQHENWNIVKLLHVYNFIKLYSSQEKSQESRPTDPTLNVYE